jgi:hypothetical protein
MTRLILIIILFLISLLAVFKAFEYMAPGNRGNGIPLVIFQYHFCDLTNRLLG